MPAGWSQDAPAGLGTVKIKGLPNALGSQVLELAEGSDKPWLSVKSDAPALQNLGDTVVTVRSVILQNLLTARIHDDGGGYWNGGFCRNCYVFQISGYDGLWIFKMVGGNYQPMVSAPLPAGVALNQLADLKFEVIGNQLTGSINGTIAIQAVDSANSHPQGTAGLAVLHYGTYDDFKVNPIACNPSGGGGVGGARLVAKATEASWSLPAGKSFAVAPNPAGSQAEAFFELGVAGRARLVLSNVAGETVLSQDLGSLSAGKHRLPLQLRGLASGLYFALLQTDEGFGYMPRQVFKLAILK